MGSLIDRSRRDFLKSCAAVAIIESLEPDPVIRAVAVSDRDAPLQPFPLSSVRLSPGIFADQAEISAQYLDSLSVDRLLYSFRVTAGLSTSAVPYKGWEAPDCELRGHFCGGHFLSAVALASATSGNDMLRERGNQLVSALGECQEKLGSGYLSAYPTGLFERLAQGKPVWAPFYTYHKIMTGLLDMYVLTGNTEALQIAEGMAQWAQAFFIGIGFDQRQRMLRTEYGGMNEALVNLAALTKKDRYLDAARLFEQPTILDPLAERRDALQGLHANTTVPKIIGAARMYEVTGDRRYRRIAEYFLEEVVTARNYAIGNCSVDEHWKTPPGHLEGTLAWTNAECCVAYNLMKLERLVFSWTADARWMDEYERVLFNCRLGTQNAQGLKQYFFPMASGYWRAYNSPSESFWCCTGTGAEEFAKFSDTIYFRRGGDLYVNQFLASTLDWKEEGLSVEQTTKFPYEQGTTLKIQRAAAARTIHVRIPSWTTGDAEIKINGRTLGAIADPGSYVAIRRVWQNGDTLSVNLPMGLRQEPLLGDDSVNAALYGPLVLAANLGAAPPDGPDAVIAPDSPWPKKNLPAQDPLAKATVRSDADTGQWIQIESKPELRFRAAGENAQYELMPLYQISSQRYATYWQLQGRPSHSN